MEPPHARPFHLIQQPPAPGPNTHTLLALVLPLARPFHLIQQPPAPGPNTHTHISCAGASTYTTPPLHTATSCPESQYTHTSSCAGVSACMTPPLHIAASFQPHSPPHAAAPSKAALRGGWRPACSHAAACNEHACSWLSTEGTVKQMFNHMRSCPPKKYECTTKRSKENSNTCVKLSRVKKTATAWAQMQTLHQHQQLSIVLRCRTSTAQEVHKQKRLL
eukprot:1161208-Pelagomonas_calceolata.AAC.5